MSRFDLNRRTIGINFSDTGEAQIALWGPTLQNVSLAIKEKNKNIALEKDDWGYWQAKTTDLSPNDQYTFVLNNEKELPDPASLSQPDGVHGPSQAIALQSFQWTDANWKNLPLEDYIIYELHAGTFTEEGKLTSVIDKLDYFKNLGVNAIEVMPVAQFPGHHNWGYDGVYPFAVQNSYGGAVALQELVNACHSKGIAVILDVVYNHLGPEGNYFSEYAPYFTSKYNTPWGSAINFDDAYCDGVRRYFIENALMWFRDFHIDALRMDAVHAIKDFSPKHILKEIKEHVDDLQKISGRNHYLIVELDLNDNRFINSIEEGGYGMDAQWIDEFHHALRVTSGGDRHGYYEDFTGINHLAKAYKNAYVYDGQYSPHRKKTFGVKAEKNKGKQFVVFSQNHDHVGNRMLGERTSQLVSFEMQKLLAGAVMVSPYLPMLFMGEEWSEPNPFLYFVDHTDPELAKAVREGRKREFAAFHAQGEAPDPVSKDSFLKSKLQWHLLQEDPHKSMLRFYRQLITLRKSQPALRNLNRQQIEVQVNEKAQTLIVHRWHENQHVYCLMNFSKAEQTMAVGEAGLKVLLSSASTEWLGPLDENSNVLNTQSIIVHPESFVLYANEIILKEAITSN